jgi:response regulator RpfG family c-di-GMP phosphodiesterase
VSEKNKKLIIYDSNSNLDLMKAAIGEQYDLTTAVSAEAGTEALLTLKPDLILLDLMLPAMSGIEFVRLLARSPDTRSIPLIVLTAYDYNSITESLLRNEPAVRFFLTKLSPISVVSEKISEALGASSK